MSARVATTRRLLLAFLFATSVFAVATVRANKGNCCGDWGCGVLDDYWVHCSSDEFCHSYTPNYPICCPIPGGFCAMP